MTPPLLVERANDGFATGDWYKARVGGDSDPTESEVDLALGIASEAEAGEQLLL